MKHFASVISSVTSHVAIGLAACSIWHSKTAFTISRCRAGKPAKHRADCNNSDAEQVAMVRSGGQTKANHPPRLLLPDYSVNTIWDTFSSDTGSVHSNRMKASPNVGMS